MKKIFLKLSQPRTYSAPENGQTQNYTLSDLYLFLCHWGSYSPDEIYNCNGIMWEWLTLDKTDDEKMVYLWEPSMVKYKDERTFTSQEEQAEFDAAFDDYFVKRWHDVPKLWMTIENYVEIVKKWQDIALKQKPPYIIFSQNDQGHVDLVGKDELSEQDKIEMAHEHKKYLKRTIAYEKYQKSRPKLRADDIWKSPEDSEFEADWQKFLDEPLD